MSKPVSDSFSKEVAGVFHELSLYRNEVNGVVNGFDKPWFKTRLGIGTTGFSIVFIAAIAAIYVVSQSATGVSEDVLRTGLQVVILLGYVGAGIVLIAHLVSAGKLFKDFPGQMLIQVRDVSEKEIALFQALDDYSTTAIRFVASRLEQTANRIGNLRSFLLGAIEKAGIIPGLLASVLALNKVADSSGFTWVEWLSVGLAAFYLSMFPLFEADLKLKQISTLLKQYLLEFRGEEISSLNYD